MKRKREEVLEENNDQVSKKPCLDAQKDIEEYLLYAASLGLLENVVKSVQAGANLEAKYGGNSTSLILAASAGHLDIVEYLVKNKAELEAKNKVYYTPLIMAVLHGHLDVTNYLLKEGANIEALNNNDRTPLLCAAFKGHVDIAKCLLQYNAELEAKDDCENTSLLLATKNGDIDMVRLLIEKGAKLEAENEEGYTPLLCAVNEGHINIVQYLLTSTYKNPSEHKPSFFIKTVANIEAKTENDYNSLQLAVYQGDLSIVKYLLQQGANSSACNKNGATLLHIAALQGRLSVVEYLLQQGAKLEAKDTDKCTPLHFAVDNGHLDVVEYLLQQGAKLETKDADGETSMCIAIRHGNLEIIKYLLQQGAKLEEYEINDEATEVERVLELATVADSMSKLEELEKTVNNVSDDEVNMVYSRFIALLTTNNKKDLIEYIDELNCGNLKYKSNTLTNKILTKLTDNCAVIYELNKTLLRLVEGISNVSIEDIICPKTFQKLEVGYIKKHFKKTLDFYSKDAVCKEFLEKWEKKEEVDINLLAYASKLYVEKKGVDALEYLNKITNFLDLAKSDEFKFSLHFDKYEMLCLKADENVEDEFARFAWVFVENLQDLQKILPCESLKLRIATIIQDNFIIPEETQQQDVNLDNTIDFKEIGSEIIYVGDNKPQLFESDTS